MTQPRLVIIACALTALVLAGGCGKKEDSRRGPVSGASRGAEGLC